MFTRRTATAALMLGVVAACADTGPAEQDRATPQEVVQKVRQAAQDLAESGEAGLAMFSSENATSVWKDSYTFVLSCEEGTSVNVAHPLRPELRGKPTAQIATFGPKSGEQIAADFCTAGRQPHGGWVEYNFPKPGETQATRKVSYVLRVEARPTWSARGFMTRRRQSLIWIGSPASSSRTPAAPEQSVRPRLGDQGVMGASPLIGE